MNNFKEIEFSYKNDLDNKKYDDGILSFVEDCSCKYYEKYIRISTFNNENIARIFQCTTQAGICMLLVIENVDSPYEIHQIRYCKLKDIKKRLKKLLRYLGKSIGDKVFDILIIHQEYWNF